MHVPHSVWSCNWFSIVRLSTFTNKQKSRVECLSNCLFIIQFSFFPFTQMPLHFWFFSCIFYLWEVLYILNPNYTFCGLRFYIINIVLINRCCYCMVVNLNCLSNYDLFQVRKLANSYNIFWKFKLSFCLILFWDRASYSPVWPQTHHVTEAYIELMVFLPLPPRAECWNHRSVLLCRK